MTARESDELRGHTYRIKTGCGNLYVTVNSNSSGTPHEVFVRLGKAGGCAASQSEAIGRLVSLCLRAGVEMQEIVRQLSGIGCHQPVFAGGGTRVLSCADAVSKLLSKSLQKGDVTKTGTIAPKSGTTTQKSGVSCPECGSVIAMEDGCEKCYGCGYTKC